MSSQHTYRIGDRVTYNGKSATIVDPAEYGQQPAPDELLVKLDGPKRIFWWTYPGDDRISPNGE